MMLDNCEVDGCCRKGTRGNENIINGAVMCDYCTVDYRRAHEMYTDIDQVILDCEFGDE